MARKRSASSNRKTKSRPAEPPPSSAASSKPVPAVEATAAAPVTDPKMLANREESHGERIQSTLIKTVIALPLLDKLESGRGTDDEFDVIIDANLDYPMGRTEARKWILDALAEMLRTSTDDRRFKPGKNVGQNQYVFARLPAWAIRALVSADASGEVAPSVTPSSAPVAITLPGKPMPPAVAAIVTTPPQKTIAPRDRGGLPDLGRFPIQPLISATIATVKADAARAAFRAAGTNIVWAVVDSGIDLNHEHFALHKNLLGDVDAWHRDFTDDAPSWRRRPRHGRLPIVMATART